MAETEKAGWSLLEVRAQEDWGDGNLGKLRWRRKSEFIYPDYEEALSWAHFGSAIFGMPSDFRVAHPTVPEAVLVIDKPSLHMVFPIPAGVDHRAYSESIYRAAPAEWLVGILLGG